MFVFVLASSSSLVVISHVLRGFHSQLLVRSKIICISHDIVCIARTHRNFTRPSCDFHYMSAMSHLCVQHGYMKLIPLTATGYSSILRVAA